MQLLFTHDNRPLLQNLTVDEAVGVLRGLDLWPMPPRARTEKRKDGKTEAPLREPVPAPAAKAMPVPASALASPAAEAHPHRPVQPDLLREPAPTPTAKAMPVAASPLAAPATEAHKGAKHGAGKHPEGYAEIALVVDQLTAGGKPMQVRRLATKLGISTRQVIHLLDRTRGTSPVVLDRIREQACNVLGIAACTQFDWNSMIRAVAARSRCLPRARRQTAKDVEKWKEATL